MDITLRHLAFLLFLSAGARNVWAQIYRMGTNIVLDVGQISGDFLNTQHPIYSKMKSYIEMISERHPGNYSSSHFLLHFQIGLDFLWAVVVEEIETLMKVVDIIQQEKQYFRPTMIITIKFPYTGNLDNLFIENYSKLFQYLSNYTSMIAGLSFKYTDNVCGLSNVQQEGCNIVTLAKRYMQQNKHTYLQVSDTSMEVGYFVEHDQLSCRIHWDNYAQIDFLIVNVVFNRPETFIESYGIFHNYMKNVETSLKNLKTITKPTFTKVYYRLTLEATNEDSEMWMDSSSRSKLNQDKFQNFMHKISKKYENLFLEYALQWSSNEDGDTKMVIVDQLTETSSLLVKPSNETVTSNLIPVIKDLPEYINTLNNNSTAVLFQQSLNVFFNTISSSGFTSLFFWPEELTRLALHLNKSDQPCSISICQPGTNVFTQFDPTRNPDELDAWLSNLTPVHLTFVSLNSYYWYRDRHPERKLKNINKTKHFVREVSNGSMNVSLGCDTWFDFLSRPLRFTENETPALKMADQITSNCELIVNNTIGDFIIAYTDLEFSKAMKITATKLMTLLDQFTITTQILTKKFPEKNIILQFSPYPKEEGKLREKEETLYCTPEAALFWLGCDAIISWASINEIPIIIRSPKWFWNNPVEWRVLKLLPQKFELLVKTYPVFLRRSYNESRMIGDWKGDMFQCIKKSSDINYQHMSFLHGFSGVTLDLDVRQNSSVKLNFMEVQMMLYFSFAKFPKVELTKLTDTKLKILIQAVSHTQFSSHLSKNDILPESIQIYLEISEQLSQETLQTMTELLTLLQGLRFQVHFCIEMKNANEISLLRKMVSETISVGLLIEDCVEEAKRIFFTTNWTSGDLPLHVLNNFDFLICQTDDQIADNEDDLNMQKYLDSHFYLKTVFHMLFPYLKEVHFRLNIIIYENGEFNTSTSFKKSALHYLADANNYASSYKTNFFLLSAFLSERTSRNKRSWWEIANHTDMTNTSVYIELEANYLNISQWKPKIFSDRSTGINEVQTDTVLAWALSGTVLIAVILMMLTAALAKRVKQNSIILTEDEIKEFLNGRKVKDLGLTDLNTHATIFEMLGYKQDYEIDKNCISVNKRHMVGFGQFGIVYSGTIQNDEVGRPESVAVKMPRNECTKEILKSMLSEVKILCYIGEHVNLVRFIGCYTKEISRGVLWVVTEFCDGGTLQSYLKQNKVTSTDAAVILPELVRLCREIACGMEYIANQKVVHGDLSARNVLLDENNICKIGDFGLSRKLYEYQTYVKQNESPMPWRWMACECLETMKFSTYSDVWSYGVTAWEIFTLGDLPYPGVIWNPEFVQELHNGIRLSKPGFATQDIYDMLLRCWELAIENRPSFSDLMTYFTDLVPYSDVL